MKFILGFPNLVSNRFRSSMIKSRGPPSLYCPLYTYLSMWVHLENLSELGDLIELGYYVQYEAKKERGDCKLLPYIRYFQHAHFMSIAGVGKRGAY